MNRTNTRLMLGVGGLSSIACFLVAASPRIYAWNQTSSAVLIAQQRAATCEVIGFVSPGTKVFRAAPLNHIPMAPGKLVCDRDGNTAEVGPTSVVQHIRSAPPEIINQILDARLPSRPSSTYPSASPKPPNIK